MRPLFAPQDGGTEPATYDARSNGLGHYCTAVTYHPSEKELAIGDQHVADGIEQVAGNASANHSTPTEA